MRHASLMRFSARSATRKLLQAPAIGEPTEIHHGKANLFENFAHHRLRVIIVAGNKLHPLTTRRAGGSRDDLRTKRVAGFHHPRTWDEFREHFR